MQLYKSSAITLLYRLKWFLIVILSTAHMYTVFHSYSRCIMDPKKTGMGKLRRKRRDAQISEIPSVLPQ